MKTGAAKTAALDGALCASTTLRTLPPAQVLGGTERGEEEQEAGLRVLAQLCVRCWCPESISWEFELICSSLEGISGSS